MSLHVFTLWETNIAMESHHFSQYMLNSYVSLCMCILSIGNMFTYHLVNVYITMENHHANGKIHYNWPFSIAILTSPEGKPPFSYGFPMVFLWFFPMRNAQKAGLCDHAPFSQELPVGEERESWGMVGYGWWCTRIYIYICVCVLFLSIIE